MMVPTPPVAERQPMVAMDFSPWISAPSDIRRRVATHQSHEYFSSSLVKVIKGSLKGPAL